MREPTDMSFASIDVQTREYRREKYACRLRVRRDRLYAWHTSSAYGLRERQRLAGVLTRWLRRCVRNQSVVLGTAHIGIDRWWEARPVLIAWAWAYRQVAPADVGVLTSLVDSDRGQTVRVVQPIGF
jgi:hypothetical protein